MNPDPRDVEAAKRWSHVADEWADMAASGMDWLRNIRDGISTPGEALADMNESLAHCRAVAREAAEARTVEGVDPDLVAVREIVASIYENALLAAAVRQGAWDETAVVKAALAAYKAGKGARQ